MQSISFENNNILILHKSCDYSYKKHQNLSDALKEINARDPFSGESNTLEPPPIQKAVVIEDDMGPCQEIFSFQIRGYEETSLAIDPQKSNIDTFLNCFISKIPFEFSFKLDENTWIKKYVLDDDMVDQILLNYAEILFYRLQSKHPSIVEKKETHALLGLAAYLIACKCNMCENFDFDFIIPEENPYMSTKSRSVFERNFLHLINWDIYFSLDLEDLTFEQLDNVSVKERLEWYKYSSKEVEYLLLWQAYETAFYKFKYSCEKIGFFLPCIASLIESELEISFEFKLNLILWLLQVVPKCLLKSLGHLKLILDDLIKSDGLFTKSYSLKELYDKALLSYTIHIRKTSYDNSAEKAIPLMNEEVKRLRSLLPSNQPEEISEKLE